MASHDREYWRAPAHTASPRGFGWTATTWLIAICIAVFVIDGFLPRQWVVVASAWQGDVSSEVRRRVLDGELVTQVAKLEVDPSRAALAEQAVFALRQNSPPQLIAVNTVQSMPFLQKWLYFSTSTALYSSIPGVGTSALQLWRAIGFQFCHADLNHIVFNMIGLFFFGPIAERYLGAKRFVAFYLLCGVAGALLYLVLNFGGFVMHEVSNGRVTIPGLLLNDPDMPLIGASAGVFGVIVAAARLMPNAQVLLFFLIPMRLITLAYGLVAVAVASVLFRWSNAGGEAAHLGGAIAGRYFIRNPERLKSIFDLLGRVDPSSPHFVGKGGRHAAAGGASAREIDRILDKVREQGIQSLTNRERETLREATRERNEGP